jgi:hypothetical protein
MNRKFPYGCLGVLGLIAVAALLFLYVNVLRPTQEIMADLRQLGDLTEMNAEVKEPGPFSPPADGALSPDQLERFARVQTSMRSALGPDYDELSRRAEKLRGMRRHEDGSITKPGFREVIQAFKGLGPLLETAKAAQVAALNQSGFSYPEYRWVRETTYRALGKENADVYLEEFAEKVLNLDRQGKTTAEERGSTDGAADVDSTAAPIVPIAPVDAPRNLILAAAFGDSLAAWEPFLLFGL